MKALKNSTDLSWLPRPNSDSVDKIPARYHQVCLETFQEQLRQAVQHGEVPTRQELLERSQALLGFTAQALGELPLISDWFERITSLSFLSFLLNREDLEEIIIHELPCLQIFPGRESFSLAEQITTEDYFLSCRYLALSQGQDWNESHPFASFSVCLGDLGGLGGHSYRATLLYPGSGQRTPKLFLRRHQSSPFALPSFFASSSRCEQLDQLFQRRLNMVICGPTGSGKTALAASLLKRASAQDHAVLIEDARELPRPYPHWTSLSTEDHPRYQLHDFCAMALRLRPDRLVLGEVRSREVIPYGLALNNGHRGLLATLHADSAEQALGRLALLFCLYQEGGQISYSQIMDYLCQGLEFIVFMQDKKVEKILKVLGSEEGLPFFEELS